MKTPIVLAAFGAGEAALQTWEKMRRLVENTFPDHPVSFAFTSQRALTKARADGDPDILSVRQRLLAVKEEGYDKAVVQSLHVAPGGEFHRVVKTVDDISRQTGMDIRIGLPLLCSPEDYMRCAGAFFDEITSLTDTAFIVIGHGMKHPAWTSFAALDYAFRKCYGNKAFVGVIEDGFPSKADLLEAVSTSGYKKAVLAPFLMTGGYHFIRDINGGNEGSFRKALENLGIEVKATRAPLGDNPKIAEIFLMRIASALDISLS